MKDGDFFVLSPKGNSILTQYSVKLDTDSIYIEVCYKWHNLQGSALLGKFKVTTKSTKTDEDLWHEILC